MPAVSKKQQRFFGIVRAAQKGTLKGEKTLEVQRAAASMKRKDVKKFASTKHKGLPEKKKMNESVAVKELEDGLAKLDYPSYGEVDDLMKKISSRNGIDTTLLHMQFKAKHLMIPDDWAKKKMFEPVMIPKTPITGDVKEGVTAKQRFKRDAGKIAKDKLRQREHERYVNFLDVDESVNSKQQDAIAMSKKERLMNLMVAKKKKKRTNESVETINELSQDTMASAAKKAMEKRDAARGTPEYGRRQKQVLKFVSGAVKKRQQRDRAENSFKKPDADRPPTLPESSFNINPEEHNKAKKQAKIRNMTKSNNPNEKKVAERKVNDKTKLPNLNTEGNLHNWFKGSKSKDGKGGWVNVVTGGTCASDEPGEGTPKCVSSSKRASMTKAERLSASRRKKKADPGQQSKSNAAKPTYVSTDKKESYIPEEGYDHIKDRIAMSGGDPSSKKKVDATTIRKQYKQVKGDTVYQKKLKKKFKGQLPSALELVKMKIRKRDGNDAIMDEYVAEKKVMGKIKRSFKRDEYGDPINKDGSYVGKLNVDTNPKDEKITHSNSYQPDMSMVEAKDLSGKHDKGNKPIKVNLSDLVKKVKNNPKNKNLGVKPPTDTKDVTEAKSAAWQRKAGKSESGGLNAKGVASYRAANPGSKLKTAVTTKPSKLKKGSKAANRRKSFCSRMKGMKSKLTSAKTARDPDSRINKSLRKWNCSFEPETGEMIMERGPQTLGFGTRKSSIHDKKKKSTKKVSGMIKSLKRKGSVLKQSMGPLDASRKASRLKNLRDDVDLTILRLIDEGHMNKTCGEGEYYCYQSKKCKKVPKGMKIGYGGMLKPDKDDSEETKGKNGNGNGNGNGHGGNGNGNGNGGGDGGGE